MVAARTTTLATMQPDQGSSQVLPAKATKGKLATRQSDSWLSATIASLSTCSPVGMGRPSRRLIGCSPGAGLCRVRKASFPQRPHPPLDVITSYLKHTEVSIVVRTHRQAEAALLRLFQWLASRFGLQINRGCLVDLKITHYDVVEFSGLSRVTATRLLRQFDDQGVIYC